MSVNAPVQLTVKQYNVLKKTASEENSDYLCDVATYSRFHFNTVCAVYSTTALKNIVECSGIDPRSAEQTLSKPSCIASRIACQDLV